MADRQSYHVEGMTCGGCEASLGRALAQVAGIHSISIRRAEQRVEIAGAASPDAVLQAIARAGFAARLAA